MADEPPRRRVRRIRPPDDKEGEGGALRRSVEESKRRRAMELEAEIKRSLAEQRIRHAELREALMEAAINWLRLRWGERGCPYCGETQWEVGTPLRVQLFPDEVMSPAFPVMCGNCGHTTFVNAVRAGIVPENFDMPDEI